MFRSQWSNKSIIGVVKVDSSMPSYVEDCPVFNISEMLERLTSSDIRSILKYSGYDYDDSVSREKQILDNNFAYEDDLADAADVFEENQLLNSLLDEECKMNKMSAGERPITHSQADSSNSEGVLNQVDVVPPKAE